MLVLCEVAHAGSFPERSSGARRSIAHWSGSRAQTSILTRAREPNTSVNARATGKQSKYVLDAYPKRDDGVGKVGGAAAVAGCCFGSCLCDAD